MTTCPAKTARLAPMSATMAAGRLATVSFIFAGAYMASNFLTSFRSDIGLGVFAWEAAIPFVEWTVVPYLSIFLLLPVSFFICRDAEELHRHTRRMLLALALAVACYALFPLEFIFDRPEPTGPLAPLFHMLWATDMPYNRSPSLHITVLLLIWPCLVARLAGWQRLVAHLWLASIGVSVLTTYQHNVIDIVGGIAVATTCFALTSNLARRALLATVRAITGRRAAPICRAVLRPVA